MSPMPLSTMTPIQVEIFTIVVAVLFYTLGAVCLWNLYVTFENWQKDRRENRELSSAVKNATVHLTAENDDQRKDDVRHY